jgi:hypothetical protein
MIKYKNQFRSLQLFNKELVMSEILIIDNNLTRAGLLSVKLKEAEHHVTVGSIITDAEIFINQKFIFPDFTIAIFDSISEEDWKRLKEIAGETEIILYINPQEKIPNSIPSTYIRHNPIQVDELLARLNSN